MSPLLYTSLRLTISCAIMMLFVLYRYRSFLKVTYKQHRQMLLIGIFISGLPSAAFAFAAFYASAGIIAIMWSSMPLFTALFSLYALERIKRWRLFLSMVAGSFGVIIVLMGSLPTLPSTSNPFSALFAENGLALIGEVAVLVSACLSAFALFLVKKHLPDIPPSMITMWQLFYGSLFVTLMNLCFEPYWYIHLTISVGGAFLYAVVCSCGCNVLTFWLVRRIGIVRTAYSDYLVPVATLILAYFLLGESITWMNTGGLILILAGALFLVRAS